MCESLSDSKCYRKFNLKKSQQVLTYDVELDHFVVSQLGGHLTLVEAGVLGADLVDDQVPVAGLAALVRVLHGDVLVADERHLADRQEVIGVQPPPRHLRHQGR